MSALDLHTSQPRRAVSATVGMIGGGQLARLTHQAAIALGVELVVLTDDAEDPAVIAGARHVAGRPDDLAALAALAERCDVVTLDHDLVVGDHLEVLVEAGYAVRPGPAAVSMAQDRALARRQLRNAGFPVPASEELAAGDVASALTALVARRPSGWQVAYPLVARVGDRGASSVLVMPAPVDDRVASQATSLAASIADGIDAVGMLAVHLVVTSDGEVLIDELATGPHESGHATIEAATTSQFENHLRAVLDWPLGATALRSPAATVNLSGTDRAPDRGGLSRALEVGAAHVHLYGATWRPGRRLGHVTALGATTDAALDTARRAADALVAA